MPKDRPPARGSAKVTASPAPRLQDTVRLSASGVAKVLGDLEARVLQTMWTLGKPTPARGVHEAVVKKHRVSPLTTITVLNKLVDKKLLSRRKVDDLFHYQPTMDETTFRTLVSRRVVEGILSLGPEAVTASLVDVLAERDPAQLEALGRLIRRRLREQG
ncbi:MAG: BlaI/MecI/CopY family transcriptional regulator [Gemmatimonas sp.]